MGSGQWLRAMGKSAPGVSCVAWLAITACACTLTACTTDQIPSASFAQPRGATVAFETIDGPPPEQFRKLVEDLNSEAETRRLAVISRESPSAYRVRGYLAAARANGKATINWVWDVFDINENRALRINGEETVDDQQHSAWAAADDTMLRRIAHSSMDELAAFLTSPGVAPPPPSVKSIVTLVSDRYLSPEAAGIFRIFHPAADPVPGDADAAPAAAPGAGVPLPRRRQPPTTVAAGQSMTLAAVSH
jgi:hypothetical protein